MSTSTAEKLKVFIASGRDAHDLGEVIRDESLQGVPGRHYLGRYYIEEVTAQLLGCDGEARLVTLWSLTLGRESWLRADLRSLEVKLFEYALAEEGA